MRIYIVSGYVNELFIVGDRICQKHIIDYWIEPESREENIRAHKLFLKFAEMSGVRCYSSLFPIDKLERIDGRWMMTTRVRYVVQPTHDVERTVREMLKKLLSEEVT